MEKNTDSCGTKRFFGHRGLTIVELIMAISIFTIGIAGFTILFARTWKANSFILEEGQASFKASNALDNMAKSLRKVKQADNGNFGIKSAGDFDLVVYLDDDGDSTTEKIHYFLDQDSQKLKKGISEPSGSPLVYPDTDQTVITLADYIVNTTLQPVFIYYNEDYPINMASNPLTTPVVLPDVRLIQIHLWVNIKPVSAPDNINLQSFVELRNLNES